jgi:CheY-like chemotaxis protein
VTASPTRILYVGLDARTEEGVTAALDEKRVSIETTTVAGPTDAMGRLESQSFDCVVSSDSLEGETGIELLRTVRRWGRSVLIA